MYVGIGARKETYDNNKEIMEFGIKIDQKSITKKKLQRKIAKIVRDKNNNNKSTIGF